MAELHVAYSVSGLGHAPDAAVALAHGREVARALGLSVPAKAEVRIFQAADGTDRYKVEVPARYPT